MTRTEGIVRLERGEQPYVDVTIRVPRDLYDQATLQGISNACAQAIVDAANRAIGIRRVDPETGAWLS